MNIKESFREYIRKLREQQGLPLRKVAAVLDIDPSTSSKIERGEKSILKTVSQQSAGRQSALPQPEILEAEQRGSGGRVL